MRIPLKSLYLCFIFVALTQSAFVQEKYLIPESISHGVYVAPILSATNPGIGDYGLSGGFQLGWTLNKSFTVGFKVSQMWSNVEATWVNNYNPLYLNFSYSGFLMAYTFQPQELLHAEVFGLIGGGLTGYREQLYGDFDNVQDDFLIMEPGVLVEVNMTHFMRVGLGLSYFIVRGIELRQLEDTDFGLNYSFLIKFGLF